MKVEKPRVWAQRRNWFLWRLKGVEAALKNNTSLLGDPQIAEMQSEILHKVNDLINYIEENHNIYGKSISLLQRP